MSTTIFPMVQPEAEPAAAEQLPLFRDVSWDCESGQPVFSGGRPVMAEGAEALRGWCWRALSTVRCRYPIFSWDYGSEVEELIGQPFTDEVKRSEAIRYIREALLVNPYITAVEQVEVRFRGTRLTISCTVSTIYGEVMIDNV